MSLKLRELVGRPWFEAILLCVEDLGQIEFSLVDIYQYKELLSEAFPDNNNVKPKIRQTLQFLRNAEIIEFTNTQGQYRVIATEILGDAPKDFSSFRVRSSTPPTSTKKGMKEAPMTRLKGIPTSARDDIDRLRDARLGEAGEQVVLHSERIRLIEAGAQQLADKVEQVSKTQGDFMGYDILSFLPNGREKWIEVKTTRGPKTSKFHISENQVATSEANPETYQLHRLYEFDLMGQTSNRFIVEGNLRTQLSLYASNYIASL